MTDTEIKTFIITDKEQEIRLHCENEFIAWYWFEGDFFYFNDREESAVKRYVKQFYSENMTVWDLALKLHSQGHKIEYDNEIRDESFIACKCKISTPEKVKERKRRREIFDSNRTTLGPAPSGFSSWKEFKEEARREFIRLYVCGFIVVFYLFLVMLAVFPS